MTSGLKLIFITFIPPLSSFYEEIIGKLNVIILLLCAGSVKSDKTAVRR